MPVGLDTGIALPIIPEESGTPTTPPPICCFGESEVIVVLSLQHCKYPSQRVAEECNEWVDRILAET